MLVRSFILYFFVRVVIILPTWLLVIKYQCNGDLWGAGGSSSVALVDIVSVALILQTRYPTPVGCSQYLSIVSLACSLATHVVCLHLEKIR